MTLRSNKLHKETCVPRSFGPIGARESVWKSTRRYWENICNYRDEESRLFFFSPLALQRRFLVLIYARPLSFLAIIICV